MAINQTITQLPTPPSTTDVVNFNDRADNFLAAIPTFVTQTNTAIVQINSTETNINSKESSATSAASTAITQAGIATTKASEASASATAAYNAQLAAEAVFDNFDDKYLGAKATAPTVDNDGNPLVTGALYFRTTAPKGIYVYDAELSSWSIFSYIPTSHGTLSGRSDADAHTISSITGLQASLDARLVKVATTDNCIMRADGTGGAVQASSVYIDDGGKVGIGTSAPLDKLGVKGSIAVTSLVGTTASDASGVIFFRGSDNSQAGYVGFSGQSTPFEFINSKNNGFNFYNGNILQATPYGLGYGAGSGGSVTQATSKSTAVTLNKPTGQITLNNASLASLATVGFNFNNTTLGAYDTFKVCITNGNGINVLNYEAEEHILASGVGHIKIKNLSAGALAEALVLNFTITKGANA